MAHGGAEYVEVPDSDVLDITGAISMECWVKTNVNVVKGIMTQLFGVLHNLRKYEFSHG